MRSSFPRQHAIVSLLVVLLATISTAPAQQEVPTRDEIPVQYTWNLAAIYPSVDAWEADFQRAKSAIAGLKAREEAGLDTPDALLATLKLRDDTRWLADKLVVYAHQLSDQDTRDNAALALKNRSAALFVSFGQAAAWIEPTLVTLPAEKLRGWCESHDELRVYRHYLENVVRQKEHTLSPREENLIATAGNALGSPSATYSVLKNAEMKWTSMHDEQGNELMLSPARYGKLVRSMDRRVRHDAFFGTMATFAGLQKTFAATFSGQVHANLFQAESRRFKSALESTIFPDNLPEDVYTNLVETINKHLPLLHQWAGLREKMLGVDELHVYDLYQPLIEGVDADIPYDDAVQSIIAALQPLGPEYCGPMEKGFASRWIDVYETQGKRPGGYSWGSYDTQPYILLNFNGTPREVSTIAHEMGHSMHSYLSHSHQPKVYGEYSMFVAEIAAIFNEILLEEHLLQQATTREEKLQLLNQQIDNMRGTVFRQVMFSEFEYEAHALSQKGEPLTADRLGQLYLDIFHKYWGPRVVRDPEHAVYWARIPHFYMNHYVYRYASSYCAATALAEGVLAEKPGALAAYLGFLKSGSSNYPLAIMRKAGVDMTTPAYVQATMRRFERLLDELGSLLDSQDAEGSH